MINQSNAVKVTPDGVAGDTVRRKLKFFWLIDISGSMSGSPIQKVNWAIQEVLPELEKLRDAEGIDIEMATIKFGDHASWVGSSEPVPLSQFRWQELNADGGLTNTTEAVELLSTALTEDKMGKKNIPPVCVLLSDGMCNIGEYSESIAALNALPWGKKAIRLSLGVEHSGGSYDKQQLDEFITPVLRTESGIETLHCNSPRKLLDAIKVVSETAVRSSAASTVISERRRLGHKAHVDINKDQLEGNDTPNFEGVEANDEW